MEEKLKALKRWVNICCYTFSGYNEILLKDMVVTYTLLNDILVDTKEWDDMIDYLWNNLNTESLKDSFDDKEGFDGYMAHDLI